MKGREAKGIVEKEKPREDGRIYSNGVRQKVEGHPALWGGESRSGCVKGAIFDYTLNLESVGDA